MFALLQAAGAADTAATPAADATVAAAAETTNAVVESVNAVAAAAAPAAPSAAEAAAAAAEAAKNAGQQNITLMDMIAASPFVSKVVLVILLLCAVYAIALMFEKIIVMRGNKKRTVEFVAAYKKAKSPEEAAQLLAKQPDGFAKKMFAAGYGELQKAKDAGLYNNRDARGDLLERIRSAMTAEQNKGLEELGSNMTFLASIGSNAPFIGLFGTVWGIMNSFIAIANTQTTSLAVVAPGIAEALFATAAGLVAAIPAVLIYNFSAKQTGTIGGYLEDFEADFISLVTRDMDKQG
ncbi:MAG: MotA/TolQ/ExbB proton channel family protein [Aquidulcibacter sp.]|jgi:biopolymer transport protein ExbB/TolQ|uniref:MotA/TolQ/ExbB proton channel family protein n=1 Tax=Aquidulcibacter sp. TaxID=2052990 RepID=UPI0022C60B6C|nr:MotA/TolQ/ExbB proton channel family protein [Aquidulcibacter sp.]MCZ8208142.1 MotA/TolQ/ExbB proton channel family protein [Aquidulcibacter sp.]